MRCQVYMYRLWYVMRPQTLLTDNARIKIHVSPAFWPEPLPLTLDLSSPPPSKRLIPLQFSGSYCPNFTQKMGSHYVKWQDMPLLPTLVLASTTLSSLCPQLLLQYAFQCEVLVQQTLRGYNLVKIGGKRDQTSNSWKITHLSSGGQREWMRAWVCARWWLLLSS